MITQNLHTHCTYCDGKNSMEDMVKKAIECNFTSLGFSSHANTGFEQYTSQMKKGDEVSYFNEIRQLEHKYNFTLFAGFEYESRTKGGKTQIDSRCDYSIGSVHLFEKDGVFYGVDNSPEEFMKAVEAFGGFRNAMDNYFSELIRFARECNYDIVGHFDLVTKFSERIGLPFLKESWYRDMALGALETVAAAGKIFEVNTGAIGRNWRTAPYPDVFLLRRLIELGAPVVITSDSHNAQTLACGMEDAVQLLLSLGFKSQVELTVDGFKEKKLI